MDASHVLIADDDQISGRLLCYLLESSGFTVTQVNTGVQALDLLQRETVDLVLLDLTMPEMGGMEVLQWVRTYHPQHLLPVIMVTDRTDSNSVVRALREGANDYIAKPIEDFDVVLVRVENQLRMRNAVLHQLRTKEPPLPKPKQFCPRCLLALFASEHQCPDCELQQPAQGWPQIATSAHRDLGRTLAGRYTLKRPLGIGSGGVVYSAFDQKLGRMYAVRIPSMILTAY
ncbi:MAG: response regulator, partial [Myxococcota bacterium]